jgi:hypothetical protein
MKTLKVKCSQVDYSWEKQHKILNEARLKGYSLVRLWFTDKSNPWITLRTENGSQLIN